MNLRTAEQNQHEAAGQTTGTIGRALALATGVPLAIAGIKRGSRGGAMLALAGGTMVYRGLTGHMPGTKMLGNGSSEHVNGTHVSVPHDEGVRVEESTVLPVPRKKVYDFWRDLTNLPRFMEHLVAVEVLDDTHSRWVAKGPAGTTVDWDAEIINEEPGERIGWRSLPGSDVQHAGSVQFRDAGKRGTEVKVTMEYKPPAGRIGAAVAKLLGQDPAREVRADLKRLKSVLEAAPSAIS